MADKVDIWMPLSIGDYLADTSHLNTTQHGAYLLMLMHYWRKGPLPNNPETLANITKLSIDAWSIHQAVLMEFYIIGDDGLLHQKRADKEREEALVKKGKSTERAKSAAAARWGHAPSNASGMLEECPLPLPLQKKQKQKPSSKDKPSPEAVSLYRAYPKHVAPQKAYAAIDRALQIKPHAELLAAVQRYAGDVSTGLVEEKYVPHPASWFNAGRYDDEPAKLFSANGASPLSKMTFANGGAK